jgi:hypothetical protein
MITLKFRLLSILLLVVLSSCISAQPPAQSELIQIVETDTPTQIIPATEATAAIVEPTSTALGQKENEPVYFTAEKGYVNIRRGPNVSYNPIGVMKPGQKALVQGRDLLGKWAMIQLPANSDLTGWVNVETEYSKVQGDLFTLPEVEVKDFAVPAYIRNCTFHNMTIQTTGEQLLNINTYPNNQLRVEPGSYIITDDDAVSAVPEEFKLFVSEGDIIDIIYDGDNNKHKCK